MINPGDIVTEKNALNVSSRTLRRNIKAHCHQQNPQQVASHLIQWGGLMLSNRGCSKNCRNLISLSEHFKPEQAVQLLKALDRFIYGAGESESVDLPSKDHWDGKQFWRAIAPYLNKSALKTPRLDSNGLPPLYASR